jgi:hypothetical protein
MTGDADSNCDPMFLLGGLTLAEFPALLHD